MATSRCYYCGGALESEGSLSVVIRPNNTVFHPECDTLFDGSRKAYCHKSWVGDSRLPGHAEVDSRPTLAFFRYMGEGGHNQKLCQVCGFAERVHDPSYERYRDMNHEFQPRPALDWDDYYCGCDGWD
jgi:hypothetical protein